MWWLSLVMKRREVGVESDNKGDSGFGGIIDRFLFQGREQAMLMACYTF